MLIKGKCCEITFTVLGRSGNPDEKGSMCLSGYFQGRGECVAEYTSLTHLYAQTGWFSFLCDSAFSSSSTEHIRTNFTFTPHLLHTTHKN